MLDCIGTFANENEGQYHWVSEFAPKEHQKFLSYVVGKFAPRVAMRHSTQARQLTFRRLAVCLRMADRYRVDRFPGRWTDTRPHHPQ
jgi:hypothetical protein